VSQSKPSEWYSHFKNGHTAINNDPHTGWPSTAQTNKTAYHIREFIIKIGIWLSENLLMNSVSQLAQYWRIILEWDTCRPTLFLSFSQKIRQVSMQQCATECCNVPKIVPSCQALLQGMKHWLITMTLRQNKCHNGRCQCHLSKRNQEKSRQNSS